MDLNIVVLSGQLAAEPELRTVTSGATLVRLLVTTRLAAPRRRVDVVPVTLWDPPDDIVTAGLQRGDCVWVVGAVQRRFWSADGAKQSRIEVVAHHVERRAGSAGIEDEPTAA